MSNGVDDGRRNQLTSYTRSLAPLLSRSLAHFLSRSPSLTHSHTYIFLATLFTPVSLCLPCIALSLIAGLSNVVFRHLYI